MTNRSRTAIPEWRLRELREAGVAAEGPFVNPSVVRDCCAVLDRRGELWAASVLGRDLTARSAGVPSRPALKSGEPHAIVAADAVEDDLAAQAIGES